VKTRFYVPLSATSGILSTPNVGPKLTLVVEQLMDELQPLDSREDLA
jgi:hypothetical protein